MPDLPTITISDQAIYDRVVAAFDADPAKYRSWLKEVLRAKVIAVEVEALKQQATQQWQARRDELMNLLPTPDPTPPPPTP